MNTAFLPLILGFDGTELCTPVAQHLRSLRPCGIILFRKNITSFHQAQDLIQSLQECLGADTIIAIDQEGGAVSRLSSDMFALPSAQALGRMHTSGRMNYKRSVFTLIEQQALQLHQLGCTLNFAPVVDLLANPLLAVPPSQKTTTAEAPQGAVGNRAFSVDSRQVVALARLWLQASRAAGIASVLKHFPGLGSVHTDPHFYRASSNQSWEELADHLFPFAELIRADSPEGVMSSHVHYPAYDPDQMATFSPIILQQMLRGELGFEGVVFTDCLEMQGAGSGTNPAQIACSALEAGNDVLISSHNLLGKIEFQQGLARGCREFANAYPQRYQGLLERIEPLRQRQEQGAARANKRLEPWSLDDLRGGWQIELGQPPVGVPLVLIEYAPRKQTSTQAGGVNRGESSFFSISAELQQKGIIQRIISIHKDEQLPRLSAALRGGEAEPTHLLILAGQGRKSAEFSQFLQALGDHALASPATAITQIALSAPTDFSCPSITSRVCLFGYNPQMGHALVDLLACWLAQGRLGVNSRA